MDDTKERLIRSTRELLWERGYVGTSPKAIQALSGAGQGSMYHHFTGKPALARAAIEQSSEELQAQLGVYLSGPGTALERISAHLHRERNILRGCPIGRLAHDPEIIAESDLREPLDAMFHWLQQKLADVIREGQKAGDFSGEANADDLAATIASVVQGAYVLARAAQSEEPFHRAIEGLLQMLSLYSTGKKNKVIRTGRKL